MVSYKTKIVREFLYIILLGILLISIYNNGVLFEQFICHGAVTDTWCTLEYVYSWLFIIYPILHILIAYMFLRVLKFKRSFILSFLSFVLLYASFFISFGELGHASQLLEQIKLYVVGIASVSCSYLIVNGYSFKNLKSWGFLTEFTGLFSINRSKVFSFSLFNNFSRKKCRKQEGDH